MEDDKELQQNQREEPMSTGTRTAITGLFGGVFWSLIGYICYLFNFSKIPPNVLLEPWAIGDWKEGVLSQFISVFILGLVSILVAFSYFSMLKKYNQIWVGLFFGLALWGIVFFILNPIFPGIPPIKELDLNTIVTSVCLFILYGVFIGYSISFEKAELNIQDVPIYSKD